MRRSLQFLQFSLFAVFSFTSAYLYAQTPTVNIFEERFDGPTVNMTSSSASGLNNNRWAVTSQLGQSAPSSDSASVAVGDILYLTTDTIDASAYVSVLLSFDHIAKIEGLDQAYVEVSNDRGLTWTKLGPGNTPYQGGANLQTDSVFSEFSDILGWRGNGTPANAATYPTNSWWRLATFDITLFAAGQPNVLVRFALRDRPSSQPGAANRAGWFLDNVIVAGASCELLPPRVVLSPPSNYPGPYGNGRVYDTGPFEFIASVTDQSGVRQRGTNIYYELFRQNPPNSGNYVSIIEDSVPIVNVSSANFRGVIPQAQIGDSIRYYLQFIDSSGCINTTRIPLVGERYMVIYPDLPQPCEDLPVFQFPYLEDFETFPFDQTGLLYNQWINGQGDFHDWWVGVDSTETVGTGPQAGKSGQKFLFLEATGHVGQEAHLISPCLDFYETPNPTLEFWYHMNGPHIDTLHIDIFDESIPGWVRDVSPPIIGSQGDAWRLKQVNFYNYRDRVVQIRLRAKAGKGGDLGDIAIDDFYVFNGPIYNAATARVYTKPYTPKTPEVATFELENFGVLPITTLDATYTVYDRNDVQVSTQTETFSSLNLLPAVKQDLSFSVPYIAPDSTFKLEVIVNLANDTANTNDTNFAFSYGLNKRTVSYFDNYDDNTKADDWVSFPIERSIPSKWKRYEPAKAPGSPSTAYSSPFVWGTNGNQKYSIGLDNSLVSPFVDFRNTDSTFVQFEMFRDIADNDGVHLEYSLDRGDNWNVILDDNNPPATLNWYNNLNIEFVPCWADTTSGFERSRIKTVFLDDLDEVLFRFRFMSDSSDEVGFGAIVDNFNIINPEPVDVAVTGVFSPLSYCEIDSAFVEYKIENFGRTPVSNIPIEITVLDSDMNTVDIVNETLSLTLNVFDTARVTSSIRSMFPGFDDYTIQVRSVMPNDTEPRNDTSFKVTESYYGCDLTLKFSTMPAVDPAGGGFWEVFVNNQRPEKRLWEPTDTLDPTRTYTRTVCVKDSQEVKINLQDPSSNVLRFEAQAFGFRYWLTLGGQQNINSASYDWICPAKLSMGIDTITLVGLEGNLPLAIDYPIQVSLLDDGLDSVDNVKVNLQIDNNPVITEIDTFVPELRYKDRRTHLFNDVWTATPGIHKFKAWTSDPNDGNYPDTRASDDTAYFEINVLDTVDVNNSASYCNDFDNSARAWRAVNAYTYAEPGNSFALGSPTKPFLSGTNSGANSWVTVLDTTYENYDSSSVVSDYIEMEAEKCYEVSFQQRFQTEEDNDGGHFQYSVDDGASWRTLYDNAGIAENWYNTEHVAAIVNNTQNAGWTGMSNWILSKNVLGFDQDTRAVFRFRYESDGSIKDEGWQIDDFCLDTISRTDTNKYNNCFPVGLNTFAAKNVTLNQNVPNPTGGYTKIMYGLKTSGMLNFSVTNMLGQSFYRESQFQSAGDHLIELNVASWADGVYFYSIEFEGERIVRKMVISK